MNKSSTSHPEKAWALIDAGYDGSFNGEAYGSVMYQNENLSVRASDAFMRAAEAGTSYFTTRVIDGQPCEQLDAAAVLAAIAEGTHLCGDPGMQFDDTIHKWHTCKGTDRQHATNPCCFTGDTLVDTSEGFLRMDELEDMDRRDDVLPRAFSFDFDDTLPALKQIRKAWVAGVTDRLVEVSTDKGIKVRCTPEHRFYLYDGTPVEARHLQPGMRLRKIARWENEQRGGRRHLNHRVTVSSANGTEIMARWMWEQAHGPIPDGMDVHHINEDRQDDRLHNLELKEGGIHQSEHSAGLRNHNALQVSEQKLLEVWEALEGLPWKGTGTPKAVTPTRWNLYVRDHALVGVVPTAQSPTLGGRIQGKTWEEFGTYIKGLQEMANDRVASVTEVRLEAPVKVYDLEVEGTHNFGVLSPGNLHSIIVSNSEYLFLDNTACNLASLNLLKFKNPGGDFNATRFLSKTADQISPCRLLTRNAWPSTSGFPSHSREIRQVSDAISTPGAPPETNYHHRTVQPEPNDYPPTHRQRDSHFSVDDY